MNYQIIKYRMLLQMIDTLYDLALLEHITQKRLMATRQMLVDHNYLLYVMFGTPRQVRIVTNGELDAPLDIFNIEHKDQQ